MSTRQEYQQKIEQQIATWRTELEHLQEKAKTVSEEKRQDYTEAIEKLRERKQELKGRYAEVKEASDGAWGDLKAGFDLAMKSLGEAIDSAKERFKH